MADIIFYKNAKIYYYAFHNPLVLIILNIMRIIFRFIKPL